MGNTARQIVSALKNIILVVLILVIVHFLLKSSIADRNSNAAKTDANAGNAKQSNTAADTVNKVTQQKQQMDELKMFVFGGEEHADQQPQRGIPLASGAPPPPPPPTVTSTYTDFVVAQQQEQQQTPPTPPPTAVANSNNKTRDLSIINQYDNESAMNGGEIFGGTGLSGYDSHDMTFSTIESSCATAL
jgi:hypothetical protein